MDRMKRSDSVRLKVFLFELRCRFMIIAHNHKMYWVWRLHNAHEFVRTINTVGD